MKRGEFIEATQGLRPFTRSARDHNPSARGAFMTTTARSSVDDRRPVSVMTPRWALKRALIGFGLMISVVTLMALLFDAAIEPEAVAPAATQIRPS